MHARTLPIIRRIRFMGDSLSDRGTLAKRKLFGIIPMSEIAQLIHRSPHGRFTNGFTWDDYFAAMMINAFISKDAAETSGEIAEDVMDKDKAEVQYQQSYTLDDDMQVDYKGRDFIKSYCEGGLTSHDYSHTFIPKPGQMFARETVSTLGAKRTLLLEQDEQNKSTLADRAQTLIIEWSGGNDLITVNERPNMQAVKDAVADRRKNMEILIDAGYRNFVLMNLPDLSLIPRYQMLSSEEQRNARECSEAFNALLKQVCDEMSQSDATLNIVQVDVYRDFNEVYFHPDKYHFDPDKRSVPYVETPEFQKDADVMPSCGAMFWDGIHPSAKLHAVLAGMMLEQVRCHFDFEAPVPHKKEDARLMFEEFMRAYHKKYAEDKGSWWFGSWSKSRLPEDFAGKFVESDQDYIQLIAAIIRHAYSDSGHRTYKIMQQVGWIVAGNKLDDGNEVLVEAKIYADDIQDKRHTASGCSIQ